MSAFYIANLNHLDLHSIEYAATIGKDVRHDGTWCLVSIGEEKIKAKIMHTGRGKYRIIEDEGDRHANKK